MKKPLTSTVLKLIACLTMLADHVGYAFLPSDSLLYALLRVIGRMAFPLYCFLLVEGVYHTKDSKSICCGWWCWRCFLSRSLICCASGSGYT